MALAGEGRRAARAGCEVRGHEGRRVGVITSGLLSPTLGHPIALALLAPASSEDPQWAEGTALKVDVRGRSYPMRVVTAPFYRRAR